ncbi:MAG: type II secretion system protein [Gemmatimonadetes bacterium]|nr:type II secretion system protein [Gemmatimonadota bacterium]
MRPSPTRDGFTLIELLIAIVIIGVLAVIAFSPFHPSPGVSLTITYSANDGWAGVTTHGSLGSAQCGFATGGAPLLLASSTTVAGVVACTDQD